MKINNIENIKDTISCKKFTANYLIDKGFMPISSDGNLYYFIKNPDIEKEIDVAPFYVHILKGGCRD